MPSSSNIILGTVAGVVVATKAWDSISNTARERKAESEKKAFEEKQRDMEEKRKSFIESKKKVRSKMNNLRGVDIPEDCYSDPAVSVVVWERKMMIASLEKLKVRLEKAFSADSQRSSFASNFGLQILPVIGSLESVEFVLLCALYLWGDSTLINKIAYCTGPWNSLLDSDVIYDFGFSISSISPTSAKLLYDWVGEIYRAPLPSANTESKLSLEYFNEITEIKRFLAFSMRDCTDFPFVARVNTTSGKYFSKEKGEAYKNMCMYMGFHLTYETFRLFASETKDPSIVNIWVCKEVPEHLHGRKVQEIEKSFSPHVLISNFDISEGYVILDVPKDSKTGYSSFSLGFNEKNVKPIKSFVYNNKNKTTKERSWQINKRIDFLQETNTLAASVIMGTHAMELLKRISVRRLTGCTIEHMIVFSGDGPSNDTHTLFEDIRKMNVDMIDTISTELENVIRKRLNEIAPLGDVSESEKEGEITIFVTKMIDLLKVKYQTNASNLLDEFASDCVPKTSVTALAIKDIFIENSNLYNFYLNTTLNNEKRRDAEVKQIYKVPISASYFLIFLLTIMTISIIPSMYLLTMFCLQKLINFSITHFLTYDYYINVYKSNYIQLFSMVVSFLSSFSFVYTQCSDCWYSLNEFHRVKGSPCYFESCYFVSKFGFKGFRISNIVKKYYTRIEVELENIIRKWGIRYLKSNIEHACEYDLISLKDVNLIMNDIYLLSSKKRITRDYKDYSNSNIMIKEEEGIAPVEIDRDLYKRLSELTVVQANEFVPPPPHKAGFSYSTFQSFKYESIIHKLKYISDDVETSLLEEQQKVNHQNLINIVQEYTPGNSLPPLPIVVRDQMTPFQLYIEKMQCLFYPSALVMFEGVEGQCEYLNKQYGRVVKWFSKKSGEGEDNYQYSVSISLLTSKREFVVVIDDGDIASLPIKLGVGYKLPLLNTADYPTIFPSKRTSVFDTLAEKGNYFIRHRKHYIYKRKIIQDVTSNISPMSSTSTTSFPLAKIKATVKLELRVLSKLERKINSMSEEHLLEMKKRHVINVEKEEKEKKKKEEEEKATEGEEIINKENKKKEDEEEDELKATEKKYIDGIVNLNKAYSETKNMIFKKK